MRIKVISVREVKCNFCFEWILIKAYHRQSLYTCSKCLEKYQSGALVHDEQDQTHRITFSQNLYSSMYSHKDASTQEDISFQNQELFPWSQVKSILGDSSFTNEQKELLGSRIELFNREYQHEAQSILDLMKELKKCKSQIFREDPNEEKNSGSRCYKTDEKSVKEHGSGYKKFSRLDDISPNLKETRFMRPYEFHFKEDEIEEYKRQEENPSDRSFGIELNNFNYDELFLNFKRVGGIKSARSNKSFEVNSPPSLRLGEDELKYRIDSYLQTRYQSISLQRIMATNIKGAYDQTNIQSKMIELVSFNVGTIDLMAYLILFDSDNLGTIKLINVGLRDHHLKPLLQWICNKKVESLVLTGNKLSDLCLSMFLNRSLPYLREIYLGKNRISKHRMKENIIEMRSKFILYI